MGRRIAAGVVLVAEVLELLTLISIKSRRARWPTKLPVSDEDAFAPGRRATHGEYARQARGRVRLASGVGDADRGRVSKRLARSRDQRDHAQQRDKPSANNEPTAKTTNGLRVVEPAANSSDTRCADQRTNLCHGSDRTRETGRALIWRSGSRLTRISWASVTLLDWNGNSAIRAVSVARDALRTGVRIRVIAAQRSPRFGTDNSNCEDHAVAFARARLASGHGAEPSA